jgi:hypothetical protein
VKKVLAAVSGAGRPDPHGGLVHQPLSGAARSGLLDLEEALSGGPALGRALKTIKEQLRAVPGKGLGYGLLRYLNDETATELAGACSAAARLQLSRPVRGRSRRRRLGAGQLRESADQIPSD